MAGFFLARLQRMFGENLRPPLASQRLETLFHHPVFARHETDDHHSAAIPQ
jgi:hypothetical protein